MFEKYYNKYKPSCTQDIPARRVKDNKSAVLALAKQSTGKRRFCLKPVLIAAAVTVTAAASLVTVNAATQGALVKFILGGEELCGYYN